MSVNDAKNYHLRPIFIDNNHEGLVEKLVEKAKINGDDSIDKHLEYLRKQYIRRVGGDKGGHWEVIG